MYRPLLIKKTGFTLIELLVVIAIVGLLSSAVLASLNSSRDRSENNSTIRQVREYITALEIVNRNNDGRYIFIPEPVSSAAASQWGCFADTTGGGTCTWGDTNPGVFPDSVLSNGTGMIELRRAIDLAPLPVPVRSADGALYDVISYRTQDRGNTYQLRYPLQGDGVDCGVADAVEESSGTDDDLTICRYRSR